MPLYTLAALFSAFWELPLLGGKVQPAELLFLVLLPIAAKTYGRKLLPAPIWWLPLGGYLAASLLSGVHSGHFGSWLESLGRVYLGLVFVMMLAYIRHYGQETYGRLYRAWHLGAMAMAVIAIGAYLLQWAGWDNRLTSTYANYPYLGTVYRANGLTPTPNMLLIVLSLPFLHTWQQWRKGHKSGAALLLLGLALALTLSKELLLIALGMALLDPLSQGWRAWQRWGLATVFAAVFWLGTHVILLPYSSVSGSYLAGTSYTSERPLLQGRNFTVIETSYFALKRANWAIGKDHPWLGTGPGLSNRYLPALKTAGQYPAHLPDYDPHSTWLGAFSETGLIGLLALLAFAIRFGMATAKPLPDAEACLYRPALRIFILLLLIQSVSLDVMNFRPLWIALALLAGTSVGTWRHDPPPHSSRAST